MMYQATYYDGKTSNPYSCVVSVLGNVKINIRYYNVYNEVEDIYWDIQKIKHSEFSGIGKSSFVYGDFPHQTLELEANSEIDRLIEKLLPKRNVGFWAFSNELVSGGFKGIFILVVLSISAIVSLYFGLLPYIAERLALKLPIGIEQKLGKEIYDSMATSFDIDTEKSKTLTQFAKKIDFDSPYDLHFVVVNENQVNAFALPGGYIVVYDKILRKMDKPEQLAALLSHEVSHINQRHSLRGLSRQYSGAIIVSILTGGSGFSDILIAQAHNLNTMRFSRGLEKDADLKGLEILRNNKINQNGMVGLMKKLKKEEDDAGLEDIPAYLSTHPLGKERIKYINAAISNNDSSRNEIFYPLWNEF